MLKRRNAIGRPKVAILTNYPYDGVSFTGGVETATAGLLEGLQKFAGEFDLHVFALARELDRHTVEERNGMTFHFIAIPSVWYARPHLLPNVLTARAQLKKLQPDLVHCQDNMALALGAISSHVPRKVFTVHGIKSVESKLWQGPEYWSHQTDALLERWVRQRFDQVITISPYVDRFLPIHVRKYHITNPVRKVFFENPQSGDGSRRLLFVGALTRLKRPMDILRSFGLVKKKLADASLTIIGVPEDKGYEHEMKGLIATRKLRDVEMLGARTQSEVAALMRRSSALVLASVQENTPMVIAEAMASGLPVIASRVGGVPLMVSDRKDGLLFECGDIDQLSNLMMEVLEDEALRAMLSKNGKARAAAVYSADAVACATVQVYRTILNT
ncbi:MAG: glycosyltransferase family 4 protein [Ignavibacteriae bacterium]|nr:glycosyltransferase family 4 protein [Ignavibacteriota bacterium]